MEVHTLQNQYDHQLIRQLEDYKAVSGKSWAQIADHIGITSSVISQYRNQVYFGKVSVINDTVRKFLNIESKKINAIKKELDFVPIENSKAIFNVLLSSHIHGLLGAIVGDTGTGKTYSVEQYKKNNNCIYLEANRTFKFPVEYLRRIHAHSVIGKDGCGTMNQLCSQIIEELKGKNVLIIIDQADYLNLAAIDIFRTINENSKQGVVFIGLPSFLTKIRGNQPEVRQVRDRLMLRCELKPYCFKEAQSIINFNWPCLSIDIQELLYKRSEGSIRILSNLIFLSRIMLDSKETDRRELQSKIIETAANILERRNIE